MSKHLSTALEELQMHIEARRDNQKDYEDLFVRVQKLERQNTEKSKKLRKQVRKSMQTMVNSHEQMEEVFYEERLRQNMQVDEIRDRVERLEQQKAEQDDKYRFFQKAVWRALGYGNSDPDDTEDEEDIEDEEDTENIKEKPEYKEEFQLMFLKAKEPYSGGEFQTAKNATGVAYMLMRLNATGKIFYEKGEEYWWQQETGFVIQETRTEFGRKQNYSVLAFDGRENEHIYSSAQLLTLDNAMNDAIQEYLSSRRKYYNIEMRDHDWPYYIETEKKESA